MEKKWHEILFNMGWSKWAYNEEEERLYLIAFLTKGISILENVTKEDFKIWERLLETNDRERVENWIQNQEYKNGYNIDRSTTHIIKDGAYNIPLEYLKELDLNIVKETVKRNNYKVTEGMKPSERRKYIKEQYKNVKSALS